MVLGLIPALSERFILKTKWLLE